MVDQPAPQPTRKPTRRERETAMARWLNDVCVDWPPLGYGWDRTTPKWRRDAIKGLAARAMDIAEGKEATDGR